MNDAALRQEGDVNFTPTRNEWYSQLSESSQRLLDEDSDYFLRQSLSTPCMNNVVDAEGVFLFDADGNRYYDFHGNSVHQLGYRNRYVLDRVHAQLDQLAFSPRRYANATATECAKRLTALAPETLNKVLFTPGGSSSISVAVKLARIATGRYKTVSMYDSFHGANLDAISVGGEQLFRKEVGPLMAGTILMPPFDSYRGYMGLNKYMNCEEMMLDHLRYVLEKEGDIAAVLAEPIRSTVVHIPSPGFWNEVKTLCHKWSALLIFDEIPTSIGRTGTLLVAERFNCTPDMLVLGKGLAAGIVPFSAVLVREDLDCAPHLALGHYTFEKYPVGCAATLASFDFIEEQNLIAHTQEMEAYMRTRLENWKENYTFIGDVRGAGLLWAIEVVSSKSEKIPNIDLAEKIFYDLLKRGISFKISSGNVLTIAPPLIISRQELDDALNRMELCFNSVTAQ